MAREIVVSLTACSEMKNSEETEMKSGLRHNVYDLAYHLNFTSRSHRQ